MNDSSSQALFFHSQDEMKTDKHEFSTDPKFSREEFISLLEIVCAPGSFIDNGPSWTKAQRNEFWTSHVPPEMKKRGHKPKMRSNDTRPSRNLYSRKWANTASEYKRCLRLSAEKGRAAISWTFFNEIERNLNGREMLGCGGSSDQSFSPVQQATSDDDTNGKRKIDDSSTLAPLSSSSQSSDKRPRVDVDRVASDLMEAKKAIDVGCRQIAIDSQVLYEKAANMMILIDQALIQANYLSSLRDI